MPFLVDVSVVSSWMLSWMLSEAWLLVAVLRGDQGQRCSALYSLERRLVGPWSWFLSRRFWRGTASASACEARRVKLRPTWLRSGRLGSCEGGSMLAVEGIGRRFGGAGLQPIPTAAIPGRARGRRGRSPLRSVVTSAVSWGVCSSVGTLKR
ncbi:hypothetical protein C7974DRAFT_390179 [Boeremia exigua]|uniref:uncharacterized protein n=1 Tax=Boeremia exigua TaxID=749465 RepID=UPI001E8D4871|nr:uncharacterized protein C7974DRAFT_390179 [Boeremia exigua]KAH6637748.1 hypothetical protein C7974DRAFT_390179 [Boeremia exigua]